jgi:hypothetical protein
MRFLFFTLLFSPLFAISGSLQEVLLSYNRPFSILEIGGRGGDLGLEIAREFPLAVVTIVQRDIGLEGKKATLLLEHLKKENPTNILLLNKTFTFSDFKNLSKTEHFDIVIAHDLLTKIHIPKKFTGEDLLQIALTLGDHLFIESQDALLHHHSNQPIFLQENWFSKTPLPPLIRENQHSFHLQRLEIPPFYRAITHIPGLSLINFLALRGTWPTKEWIKKELSSHFTKEFSPSHLVLMGSSIYLYPAPLKEAKPLKYTLDLLDCTSQHELREHLFSQ